MKPLNRPMFKYGGPIKEGIMTGMKEKQAINTVGSPLAPKDETGRGGYAAPLLPVVLSGLATAGRFALRPLGKFAARTLSPGKGNIKKYGGYSEYGMPTYTTKVMDKAGPILQKGTFQPTALGNYLIRSPEFRLGKTLVQGTGRFGKPIKSLATSAVKSPLTLGTAGVYGAKGLYNMIKGEKEPEVQAEIEAAGGPPGGGDPEMFARPKEVDQKTLDQMNKDRIQKNKERYYKLMGIDKMNKEAVYDSLIDASKIIQQEGGDLKGALKSGSLQSQIIDAISKQLDKSSALKRQIDAAVLKGEIEKDIKASDPQSQKKADLIDKQIALADKQLSGGSLIENIQAGAKAQGNINSTSNVYNSILKTYNVEPEVLADTAETLKFRKADNYTTDSALVKSLVEAQGKGAGIYIIDKTAVLIDENGNASTLFQG